MESPVPLGALSGPLPAPGIGSELEWAGQRGVQFFRLRFAESL